MNNAKCDILLVDDDPGLLRLLTLRLQAAGYGVEAVENGEDALVRLGAALGPRLVITDMRMSGMDGMALFHAVQQRRPDIPVIILTAHGTIPDAVRATQAGVFSFLTKPFDSKELLDQVSRALALSSPDFSRTDGDWRRDIVTRSAAMEALLAEARLVAQSEASVLITGESGTGKELLARALHRAGARRDKPFMAVNCSAIPAELLESELFGHNKGAFTGATSDRDGLLQAADGGILFLDEIGDMPLILQAKLLRAVQERQVRPVGSTRSVAVDLRIISATHRNLENMVEEQMFREDLYYRLSVVALNLPPLRERREDILVLANLFLSRLSARDKRRIKAFAPEAMDLLICAPWPGNVRQLSNVVEYCVALSPTPVVPSTLVRKALRDNSTNEIPSLVEARQGFERDYLTKLLQLTGGNVTRAARLAQRNRTEFYKLLNRHQLNPALFKESN